MTPSPYVYNTRQISHYTPQPSVYPYYQQPSLPQSYQSNHIPQIRQIPTPLHQPSYPVIPVQAASDHKREKRERHLKQPDLEVGEGITLPRSDREVNSFDRRDSVVPLNQPSNHINNLPTYSEPPQIALLPSQVNPTTSNQSVPPPQPITQVSASQRDKKSSKPQAGKREKSTKVTFESPHQIPSTPSNLHPYQTTRPSNQATPEVIGTPPGRSSGETGNRSSRSTPQQDPPHRHPSKGGRVANTASNMPRPHVHIDRSDRRHPAQYPEQYEPFHSAQDRHQQFYPHPVNPNPGYGIGEVPMMRPSQGQMSEGYQTAMYPPGYDVRGTYPRQSNGQIEPTINPQMYNRGSSYGQAQQQSNPRRQIAIQPSIQIQAGRRDEAPVPISKDRRDVPVPIGKDRMKKDEEAIKRQHEAVTPPLIRNTSPLPSSGLMTRGNTGNPSRRTRDRGTIEPKSAQKTVAAKSTIGSDKQGQNSKSDKMSGGDEGKEERRKAVDEIYDGFMDEASCVICMSVMVAPHQISPCGHVICGPCGISWFEARAAEGHDLSCPSCRKKVANENTFVPVRVLENIIEKWVEGRHANGGWEGYQDWKDRTEAWKLHKQFNPETLSRDMFRPRPQAVLSRFPGGEGMPWEELLRILPGTEMEPPRQMGRPREISIETEFFPRGMSMMEPFHPIHDREVGSGPSMGLGGLGEGLFPDIGRIIDGLRLAR
ncbi:hypothetical protein TREMEDRAFT_63291 [Tremella mesenterica DSM 1558]|uniref:uncharacterized protein n=1 Tax=Tremella mesenterica (strain ATCC 24925 / CBS 8224 / DSM 1558 / NBRC 9311 / NRRL Y-6157 / RJB 2259-6 / UBC 559-6) TaxID=578456 RepID=UPI0003F49830|nr:uncharacterized protein TREMEDRAFT_63291 [Tremella mesenterica DSM 1558]EIW68826.1 hypothetical protein TREMEDRAFT_63291 [Tremella mesenterica DSM 1558]